MKKYFLLPILALFSITGCQPDTSDLAETGDMEFTYDTLQIKYSTDLDSSIIFHIDLPFPYWNNQPELNSFIEDLISHDIWPDSASSLSDALEQRIQDLKSFTDDYGEIQTTGFTLDGIIDTVYSDSTYLILKYSRWIYSGGAHGIALSDAYLMDLVSMEPKSFWEILDTATLKAPMERALRSELQLSADAPWSDASWIEKFEFPSTIYFDRKNIYAIYQPYEIRSYAEGPVIFSIPISKNYFKAKAQP